MSESSEPGLGPVSHATGQKKWVTGCFTAFAVVGILGVLVALMLPTVRRARPAARRSQCRNNLRLIALALHNYAEAHQAFPPAYTTDGDGNPLHSWRTLILPYLDQAALYQTIDLSRPWDDPVNAAACNTRLSVYECPSDYTEADRQNHTTYLGNAAIGGCLHSEPRPFSEITDGLANTLMIIEAPSDRSVPWMSPEDADETLIMNIGKDSKFAHVGGTHAALCDGSVRFVSAELSATVWRALISIAAGDIVGDF